jgi:gluconolactonase
MNYLFRVSLGFIIVIILPINFTQAQVIDKNEKWVKVLDNLNFPEGPAWDGKEYLYLSNCYGSWITRFDGNKFDTLAAKTNDSLSIEKTNGLAIGKDGYIYACEYGYGAILKIALDGKLEILCSGYAGEKFNRPNDIVIDNSRNIYFTDPKSYDPKIPDGRIFRIDIKENKVKLVAEEICFPNGINISPEGKRIYVSESAKNRIISYDIDNYGMLINKNTFIDLPGGDPDGIDIDENGNLYVAHFGGKSLYIISPEGKIIQKIETPGKKPSNTEFGGSELKTLYLTEDETNALYSIKTKIPGFKR